MATQPDEPTDEPPYTIDPQFVADRERDIRMCAVRAAMDLHQPGESTASAILGEAKQILSFINGGE